MKRNSFYGLTPPRNYMRGGIPSKADVAFEEILSALIRSPGTQAVIRERRAKKVDPFPPIMDLAKEREERRARNRAKKARRRARSK